MSTTIVTESGRTKDLPAALNLERVAGLDHDGRIVVDDFDALHGDGPFLYALTLCCNASDKGVEDGVVCRGCYGYDEIGAYLYPTPDRSFPGLDRVKEVR